MSSAQRRKSTGGKKKAASSISAAKRKAAAAATAAAECEAVSKAELEALYRQSRERAEFDPPGPKELETIFEGTEGSPVKGAAQPPQRPRRGAAAVGGLALGKYKSRRVLEASKYWLEDKDKSRHRAQMTAKACKGKKKFKVKGLSAKQEGKLIELLESQQQEEEEENEVEEEVENKAEENVELEKTPETTKMETPFVTPSEEAPPENKSISLPSPAIFAAANATPVTPRLPLVQLNSPVSSGATKKEVKKGRRRSSLFKALVTTQANAAAAASSASSSRASPSPDTLANLSTRLSEGTFTPRNSPIVASSNKRLLPRRVSKTPSLPSTPSETSGSASPRRQSQTPSVNVLDECRIDEEQNDTGERDRSAEEGEEEDQNARLPNEELLRRQIEEADSLFGTFAQPSSALAGQSQHQQHHQFQGGRRAGGLTATAVGSSAAAGCRRKSVVVRVRRSTRLRRGGAGGSGGEDSGGLVGTVYEEAEVALTKRRRRSIMDLHSEPQPQLLEEQEAEEEDQDDSGELNS